RVALARAIVNNADIIIADEPTGNVDAKRSYEIVEMLNKINATGTTVIMVTHSEELVRRFGRRVITIQDGRIKSDDVSREKIVAESALPPDLNLSSRRAIREADEFIRNYKPESERKKSGGESDE
ncbi:MAG: cell division ATP-binding protein FtsE, partial [Clostridia bacterium]|nr:cell division ATP-binding protein FtsE [Clostridia bacterium]